MRPCASTSETVRSLLVLDNLEQRAAPHAAGRSDPLGRAEGARARDEPHAAAPLRRARVSGAAASRPGRADDRFEDVVANDAVRLFAARARAVDPVVRADGRNLGSVAAVCRRLDGLPLALELAAAWITVLSPAEIERGWAGARPAVEGHAICPQRQQTLRATLDWSYDLLAEARAERCSPSWRSSQAAGRSPPPRR